MIELSVEEEQKQQFGACLKVLGIGGAGGNAVNSMIATADIERVEFITANTDAQALDKSSAQTKIQLGAKITKGLGAGSNPDIGRRAAEEDMEKIIQHAEQADILFLTAGLGGGTGSGSLPVIAQAAREMGVLTIAIVTKPFVFEGKRRMAIAEEAVENIKEAVDTLIVVPNQRLLEIADDKISMLDAFALSNDILKQAIKGISDIIIKSGHINVDFADVRTIMKDMGIALMGTGRASGQDRAKKAALAAITSPLLENVNIQGAKGVLINITGNTDLGLYEINEAASTVYDLVSEDANIILGSVIDTELENDILVTVIATGFEQKEKEETTIKGATVSISEKTTEPIKVDLPHSNVQKQEYNQKKTNHQEEALSLEPEKKESNYDLNDFDTPTFLRKKQGLQKKYPLEQNDQQQAQSTPTPQQAEQQASTPQQTERQESKNQEQKQNEHQNFSGKKKHKHHKHHKHTYHQFERYKNGSNKNEQT